MQQGSGFGRTGPDSGYALSLIAGRRFELAEGERRADVDVALAAIVSARASLFGRAPTGRDVDMASVLYPFVSALDAGVLSLTADEARSRMAAGTSLITY